uniref:Uncharacterized protein n=1 Tax=Cacopsylla melanoneura TaxID=428564 RepID=A0A8D8PWQ5_9HEMI
MPALMINQQDLSLHPAWIGKIAIPHHPPQVVQFTVNLTTLVPNLTTIARPRRINLTVKTRSTPATLPTTLIPTPPLLPITPHPPIHIPPWRLPGGVVAPIQ